MTGDAAAPKRGIPDATPVSRVLRFGLGGLLVASLVGPVSQADMSGVLRLAGVVAALVLFYALVHVVVTRYLSALDPWLGALLAVAPVLLVASWGGTYLAGAVLFIGASLLLMALLGHPGCEVLAFPSLFLGRRTHLACLLFSPIDWLETRVSNAVRRRRG